MKKLLSVFLCLNLLCFTTVSADSASDAKVKNQVITLVTSSIGTNILLMCALGSMQPSLYAFMAGSATHVLTEVDAGRKIKRIHEINEAEVEAFKEQIKNGGEVQKLIIEKKLADEEAQLEFVNKRIRWLKIVRGMYVAATTLAGLEVAREIATLGTVTSVAGCTGGGGMSMITGMSIVGAYTYQNIRAGGAFSALMYNLLPIHSSLVPALYQHGATRVATFTAATYFIDDVVKDLGGDVPDSVKSGLERNIEKLRLVLNSFNENTSEEGRLAEGNFGSGNVLPGADSNYALKALPKVSSLSPHCLTNKKGMTVSADGCKSKFTLTKPKFNMSFNTPTLKDYTHGAVDLVNALGEGNMERAEVLASGLASQAGRIESIKDDAIKKMKENLKAAGKDFDLESEVKKQTAMMNDNFNKAAQGAGSSSLASTGKASLGTDKLIDPSKNETSSIVHKSQTTSPSSNGLSEFKESFYTEEVPINEKVATLESKLGEFETNENDIAKNPETSIFKQVSHRYILNYSKIFDRKKLPSSEGKADQLK